jgi:hypothetical protein
MLSDPPAPDRREFPRRTGRVIVCPGRIRVPSWYYLGEGEETMGTALYFLGLILCFVGGIWILVNAFKTSILWGLGALFIPFVSLIFAIMHWDQNKKPFLISIAGIVVVVVGVMMGAGAGMMQAQIPH